MRTIIEAALLALCSLIFAIPGPSETVAQERCYTKENLLAQISRDVPNVIPTDLAGPYEKLFLANLSRLTGEDMLNTDVVLYRAPGRGTTLLIFFNNGCADTQAEIPNNMLATILNMA